MDFSLCELVSPLTPIKIIDVGARPYVNEPVAYEGLLSRTPCRILAIEQDATVCAAIMERLSGALAVEVVSKTIGDGDSRVLYVTNMRSRSSLFEPDYSSIDRYNAMSEYTQVMETAIVDTVTLDSIAGSFNADYIKIDIQGAELMAVRGGASTFSNAVIAEVEVNFFAQYIDQPLFSEVETALRAQGFSFHTFLGFGTRALKPWIQGRSALQGVRQWLWSDAVFVRRLSELSQMSDDKLIKAAIILHDIYRSYDFANYALQSLDGRHGSDYAARYRTRCDVGLDSDE